MFKVLNVKKNETDSIFELELDNQKFNLQVEKTHNKIYSNYEQPGFRKGHVPKNIFDTKYPLEAIRYQALEDYKNELFMSFFKSKEFEESKALDYIKNINVLAIGDNNSPVKISLTLEMIPKVLNFTTNDIKNIVIEKDNTKQVDKSIIDNDIRQMLKKEALVSDKKDKIVQLNDIAVIDYKGFIDNKPFAGGEGRDFDLEIGSKSFIDNFEQQLIGLKKGDKKDVNVQFPNDYHAKELAGKNAKFEVEIKDVKTIEYPKLTKEFLHANNLPDEVVDEVSLRKYISDLYADENEFKYQQKVMSIVNKEILEKAKLNYYSLGLIDIYKRQLLQQYETQAKQYGFKSFDEYIKQIKINIDDFTKQLEKNAKDLSLTSLVFDELIKSYKITAEPNDIDEFIKKISRYRKVNLVDAKKEYEKNKIYFESQIINNKLINKIISECKKK